MFQFANGFSTNFTAAIGPGDTVALPVVSVAGLPVATVSDPIVATFENTQLTTLEIVHITSVDTINNTLTVLRAQEGTTAVAFAISDFIQCRLTAGILTSLQSPDTITDHTQLSNIGINTHAQIDAQLGLGLMWQGEWQQQTYAANDLVRDGVWTMVALNTTDDRAGPQAVGAPERDVDDDILGTASDISVVTMDHQYTLSKSGLIEAVYVQVPAWDLDTYSKITMTNITRGTTTVVDNPNLSAGVWVLLGAGSLVVQVGDVINLEVQLYNSTVAASIVGEWNSVAGTAVPGAEDFTIDNFATPTVMDISYTDLDAVDRTAELDGVAVGSIIRIAEAGDSRRNVQVEVTATQPPGDSATSIRYNVVLLQNGDNDLRNGRDCRITIDVPITLPTQYNVSAGYYPGQMPGFASSVVTSLAYGSAVQPSTTDAYGIDLSFQEAVISPDWELVALSSASGQLPQAQAAAAQASLPAMLGVFTLATLPVPPLAVGDTIFVSDANPDPRPAWWGGVDWVDSSGVTI